MQQKNRNTFTSDEQRRQDAKPGADIAKPGDKDEQAVEPPVGSPAREHALIKDGLRKREDEPDKDASPGAASDAEMAKRGG